MRDDTPLSSTVGSGAGAAKLRPRTNEAKRLAKQQTFRELRDEYQSLKTSWGGYAGYDRWFGQELNNAHLASIAIYTELVPAFRKLLQQEQGDFVRFYAAVKRLTKQSKDARAVFFQSLGYRALI